jgi:hypothetical protein
MAKPVGIVLNLLVPAAVAGLLLLSGPARATADEAGRATLENQHIRIEIDPANGVIARVLDKDGQIDLVPAADLADNFHLLLRGANKEEKTILGRKQPLSKVAQQADALELNWTGPLSDTAGGQHQISVRMAIRLAGPALEFRCFLRNGSDYKVSQVWYPQVGGLVNFGVKGTGTFSRPEGRKMSQSLPKMNQSPAGGETFVMLPISAARINKIALPLPWIAAHYPGEMNMSYSSVYNTKAKRAMYFASHDTMARLKYFRFFEQHSPAGKDVFAAIEHVPFTPPGKSFEGSPVVLRFHNGDWQAAGPIYRQWFSQAFGIMKPSWIRSQSFIQDTMFLYPEGTVNMTFQDIPRWAKDAREHGLRAVLISGWHHGGHDNGYPHYEPDPRLGTYEDLRRGLAACHAMGVRVYFFINYQPAMIESDWFKNELRNYLETDENGNYHTCGWGMATFWARTGHPKLMTSVDPSFPAYRDALLRQFLKLVEVGADGVHVDKMFPRHMNFNPRCQLGPDISTWQGALELTRLIYTRARKINPNFAMSFECNWDRMLEFGNAIWWVGNMSIARTVFPEMIETRAVTSPYDYPGVNNTARSSQVGLLGPQNYSRSIGWEPWHGLARYLGEVKRIQESLADAVFYGQALGHGELLLEHDPDQGVEYAVYRGLNSGKRVGIFTNSSAEDRCQGISGFAGKPGGVRIHEPFLPPREAALPVKLTIPAQRIVFVEELPGYDPQRIKLENERYRVEVSRRNGALVRILDKTGKLDLIREPRLTDNFRFTLPLPGKEPWQTIEANYILGKEQPLASFELTGDKLTLHWGSPMQSRTGEKYDAAATMTIAFEGDAVRFTLSIDNKTPYQVGEVFFPIIGGMAGLGNKYRDLKATQLIRPAKTGPAIANIFACFSNNSEFGDQGPEQGYLYPRDMPETWTELYSPALRRSMYFGCHDRSGHRATALRLEMRPGVADTPRGDGNWPHAEELNGLPCGLMMSFVEFANHPAGKVYEAPPVILQMHDGDWHEGQKIYHKAKEQ